MEGVERFQYERAAALRAIRYGTIE